MLSKGEYRMRELLARFLPDEPFESNYRPEWLVNPETGWPLELDRYYPRLTLAFEYQGAQHYGPTALASSPTEYLDQNRRDALKRELCKKRGIFLIYVHHSDLNVKAMQTLLDGAEQSRAAGRWWHGVKYVTELRFSTKSRRAKKRAHNSKQFARARAAGVLGSERRAENKIALEAIRAQQARNKARTGLSAIRADDTL